ncbi:MAG: HEAT repeat domain-containing protein [Candidatus Eremiobacterota bacterium]
MAESAEIYRIIEELKSQGPAASKGAAEFLDKLDSKTEADPFIEALGSDNSLVRKFAAEGLGKLIDQRSIKPLINALSDESMSVRKFAAEALGKLGDPCSVEPLINTLNDENIYVRKAVAESLGKLEDISAVGPLINALSDQNLYVRWAAVDALGKLNDGRAVDPLIGMLKDKESYVRWASVKALGELRDKKAIEPLKDALKDDDAMVRISAKGSISKLSALEDTKASPSASSLKAPPTEKLIPLSKGKQQLIPRTSQPQEAPSQVIELKPKKKLLESRRQDQGTEEEQIIEEQSGAGARQNPTVPLTPKGVGAKPRLFAKSGDGDGTGKGKIMGKPKLSESKSPTLPSAGEEEEIQESAEYLQEEDRGGGELPLADRAAVTKPLTSAEIARQALMKMREKRSKTPETSPATPEETQVKKTKSILRSNAFQAALKRLKDKSDTPEEKTPSGSLPSGTSGAGATKAPPSLEDDLYGKPYEEEVETPQEEQYAEGEEEIREEDFDDIEKIFNILMGALQDEDQSVRKTAIVSLGELADARAVDSLVEALFCEKEIPLKILIEEALGKIRDKRAVDPLVTVLQDEDPEVRRKAAETLGIIGDPRSTDALIKALYDVEASVRGNAIMALEKLRTPAVVPSLLALLKDESSSIRKTVVETLGNFGDKRAVDGLIEALKDEDSSVRASSAVAIGKLGDQRGLPYLKEALNDPDFFVSMYAQTAIKNLQEGGGGTPPSALPSLEDELFGPPASKVTEQIYEEPEPPVQFQTQEEEVVSKITEQLPSSYEEKFEERFEERKEDFEQPAPYGDIAQSQEYIPETVETPVSETDFAEDTRAGYEMTEQWGKEETYREQEQHDAYPPLESATTEQLDEGYGEIPPEREIKSDIASALLDEEAAEIPTPSDDMPQDGSDEYEISREELLQPTFKRPLYTPPHELIDDVKLIKDLIKQLRDADKKKRQDAAEELGKSGNRAAVKPLIKALKDADPHVRWRAAAALGKLRDESAVEEIKRLLNDPKDFVREYAVEALGTIGDLRAVDTLMSKGLRDKNNAVKLKVVKALVILGDPKAIEPIREQRKKAGIFQFTMKKEMDNAIKKLEANI